MNRREQTELAAQRFAETKRTEEAKAQAAYDFVVGAEWAYSHPQWIPVEERLPGEGQVVLGVREGGTDVEMYKFMGFNESTDTFDWEWHPYYRAVVDDVTHWMPLPKAPRKEE